ncbi:MAG: PorV/PorQ family protein [Candidatus Latescibacterota bacterium]|nr:MAG: PorV/PorQ family protein [Candidatus Latescibacterota bacterium]
MRSKLGVTIILGILVLSLPASTWATEPFAKVGTYSLQFLKIGPSSRPSGMGNAFTALADDASATYWNPAGMVDVTNTAIMLEHTFWPADIALDYASVVFTMPFLPGTWGASARALSMDPQKERTIFLPGGTGREFDAGDMSFGLSYAQFFTDKFSAGATVHFVHSGLAEKSVNTYTVDFGLIYRIGFRGMRLGMMIQSLGGKVDYDSRDAKIPTTFKVGLSMAAYRRGAHSLNGVGEFSHPSDNTETVNLGGEYAFNQFFYLRGGYNFGYDARGAAFGFGLKINTTQTSDLDFGYAWEDYGFLGDVHRLTLGFSY